MKNSMYLLAVIALTFTACKNEEKKTDTNDGMNMTEMKHENDDHDDGDHDNTESSMNMNNNTTSESSNEKNATTSDIIDGYMLIKNSLVTDDKDGAKKGGEVLLKAFSNFDMSKLTDEQHIEYMDILENAKEQTEHIVESPIEHQREHFEILSNDMSDLIALLGTDKTLYQNFCPMFNDGKGGIWFSEIEEIKNPFYGSKMLKCGKTQRQIN